MNKLDKLKALSRSANIKVHGIKKLADDKYMAVGDKQLHLMTVAHHLSLKTLRQHLGDIPKLADGVMNEDQAKEAFDINFCFSRRMHPPKQENADQFVFGK